MGFDTFDIYFNGEILPEQDSAAVRTRVGELFKLDERGVEKLFAGGPVRVKQAVDADKAGNYRERFRRAGALVRIVPHGQPFEPAPKRPATAATPSPGRAGAAGLELMPAGTGSLADCAPPAPTFDVPDLSTFDLAAPGTSIDTSEPPAPVDIDVDDLTMTPEGTGSLEDCQRPVEATPVPDVSTMDLAAPGAELDESPPAPAAAIDIGDLSVAPPNSGSLEDCVTAKPPAPIPDISDLKLVDD